MFKFETPCEQNEEFWTGHKTFNKQSTKFVNICVIRKNMTLQ